MEQTKKNKFALDLSTPFKHTLPIQLRFSDIDSLGHVNNSVYFSLFDLGKADYFNTVRGGEIDWKHVDIVVANVNCNFLAQTFFTEPIAVQTQTLSLGEKSITLVQQLVNSTTGEVKAQCTCVMVSIDLSCGRTTPLAEHWRNAIVQFEGRDM